MLRNTWTHVQELALAYPGEVVPYVLDDGASEEAAAAAREFGFRYVVRSPGLVKKAGNLRHAFSISSGEFIAIFDADFAPRADLAAEMLPYFYAEPGLGS